MTCIIGEFFSALTRLGVLLDKNGEHACELISRLFAA
jgi:hypothetical protein